MFEKDAIEQANKKYPIPRVNNELDVTRNRKYEEGFKDGAEFGYNKADEWHNIKENPNDLPNEGEWVEGLYIWHYDKSYWDVFKVRWYYEIGELDEKLVRWYSSDENNSCERDYWNKVDEPDYWRKITLPMMNEHDRNY